jgi:acetylornithine/succinyldiaminopimelate/putrescine aminotransferase
MKTQHPFLDTCDELIQRRTPNLFRMYLNSHVVQACYCLHRYIHEIWHTQTPEKTIYQSFLANSFDEALSGAIKLARYSAGMENRPQRGLVLDYRSRLGPFASVTIQDNSRIDFIPNLLVLGEKELRGPLTLESIDTFGFAVLVLSSALESCPNLDNILSLLKQRSMTMIVCVDRLALDRCRIPDSYLSTRFQPDIVVFDESFTRHHVPFGAFSARTSLFRYWNTPKNATFHSTTYQPNSISSLHFLKCVENDDPQFFSSVSEELGRIRTDPALCHRLLGDLYNPSLRKSISVLGLNTFDVQAAGHYVITKGRKVFDGVGGVACSVRGHNPENFVAELAELRPSAESHVEVGERLHELTGLKYHLPAVSGASAVENALRIGLTAQYPKDYVLALKGGFGGKTLLALTGTAREAYKRHIGSLYEKVIYIDPFAENAIDALDHALQNYPIGIVQMELIQGVGGVRPIPLSVIRYLADRRVDRNYLLFVDEVQTGMYRTGPFSLCEKLGLAPDLMTIGKGASDMMFPFAATLYSSAVEARLEASGSDLAQSLRQRCEYEFGYKTLLNTLKRAEKVGLSAKVTESGNYFAKLLTERLSSCTVVRDVRVFGLLIAIELDTNNWIDRFLKGKAASLYIYNLLQHPTFPVFMGFCQYEPNVLKFTPPLSITRNEIEQVCDTIADSLSTPAYRLLPSVGRALTAAYLRDKWKGNRRELL